jgi:putative sigma-54 modulation protein
MRLEFVGRHFDVTDALRTYVENKLSKIRFADRVTEGSVTFEVEKHRQICEIALQGDRFTLRSQEESHDMYFSVDKVAAKLERQLTKQHEMYKKKRTLDKRTRQQERIDQLNEPMPDVEDSPASAQPGSPEIETVLFPVKPMSLDEALAQIRSNGAKLLAFRNAVDDQVNVLYRKEDQNFELLQPDI